MLTGERSGDAVAAEGFHSIDQSPDAVGLLDDELGERRMSSALTPRLQKLGRAADAGERILDLVRQHLAEAHHRVQAGGIGVAVDAEGRRAHAQGHEQAVVDEGRRGDVGDEGRKAEYRDLDAALAHRADLGAAAIDEGGEPRPWRQGSGHRLLAQESQALTEQLFRRFVDGDHDAGRVEQERRFRPQVERRGAHAVGGGPHAASLSGSFAHRASSVRAMAASSSIRHRSARAARRWAGSARDGAAST